MIKYNISNFKTKLKDNFRCSYKEDGFDKFWKDNQIEYGKNYLMYIS